MSRKIEIPDFDDFLRRYVAGESEYKLARELGINRSTFRLRLIEKGISPRGIKESQGQRWSHTTVEERKAHIAAAHRAARGRVRSNEEAVKAARTAEATGSRIVAGELTLGELIEEVGGGSYSITRQKAVGRYNLDIAINEVPVAVEIYGGGWHSYGQHRIRHFDRIKYLLNSGWHVIIVWVDGRRYSISIGAAEYIVTVCTATGWASIIEHTRGFPPLPRQYRVIRGNGQDAAVRDSYFNTRAAVEALGCCFDTAGNHYFVAG